MRDTQTRHCVHLSCDGGRICRPLLVLNKETGRPYLTQKHVEELRRGTRDIVSLVHEVDSGEELHRRESSSTST